MRALALLLALAALDRSDAGNSKDMSMTVAQSASSIDTGDPKVILTLTKTGGALVSTDRVFLASGSTCASFTYGLNVFKTTAGKAADTATDKHAGETDYTNAAVTKVASFSESVLVGGWDGTAKAFTFKLPALTQYWNRRWRVCYFDSTAQGGTEIGGGAGYNANDACDDTGAQVYLTSTLRNGVARICMAGRAGTRRGGAGSVCARAHTRVCVSLCVCVKRDLRCDTWKRCGVEEGGAPVEGGAGFLGDIGAGCFAGRKVAGWEGRVVVGVQYHTR